MIEWPEGAGAPPLHATPRDLTRRTDGRLVDVVARSLGTPLIPWQRHVADVAGERLPDGSYAYQIVLVSVPRQTGKTTLLRAVGTKRALVDGRDVFYTAQTGKDARARWLDLVKQIRLSDAYADRVKIALRGGSEHLEFPSGAKFQVFAPTPESLHGYTPPTVMVDEAFAHSREAGELLMGAIGPAQITIRERQIWLVSTAGTAESEWWHEWLERALEGMPRVAVFLWGAGDETDVDTAAGISSYHPGVGFELNGKILEPDDVLGQLAREGRAEYERAYANRRTLTASHRFPAELLRDLVRVHEPPADSSRMVLAYDAAIDRSAAAIVAVWLEEEEGRDVARAKVVLSAPGLAWVPEAIVDLERRWRCKIAADDSTPSPTREITAALAGRVPLELLKHRDYASACGDATSRLDEGRLYLDGTDVLLRAYLGLALRPTGDGDVFSRRASTGNTAPAIATTVATWVATRAASTDDQPLIYLGAS